MSKLAKAAMMGAAGAAGGPLYVEDVFSNYLYEGNDGSQTITNGIDVAGEGGLIWIKDRLSISPSALYDTERTLNHAVFADSRTIETETTSGGDGITSYTSSGFNLGGYSGTNSSSGNYVSWTFRKAPKFFDVVTYSGNSSTKTVSHNLGSVPGCIIIKALNDETSSNGDWYVYHRSLNIDKFVRMNVYTGVETRSNIWNSTRPTDTEFYLGNYTPNLSGKNYVAYLFAHDAGGFGEDETDDIIHCGIFPSATGTNIQEYNIGWEPQYLFVLSGDTNGSDKRIYDSMRGFGNRNFSEYGTISHCRQLRTTTTDLETDNGRFLLTPTGFKVVDSYSSVFIAIRRGPMKTPTDATEVFNVAFQTGSSTGTPSFISGFPVDAAFNADGLITAGLRPAQTRLVSKKRLFTNRTIAEDPNDYVLFDYMNGWNSQNSTSTNNVSWMFRRAPGFFDVVAYMATGGNPPAVSHNLGVVPTLIIQRMRSTSDTWWVFYYSGTGVPQVLRLNTNQAKFDAGSQYIPTATQFYSFTASSTNPQIAYLFATCPGVSKVGSYTGTGTTLNVDCGFSAGARFVLIKRTDTQIDGQTYDTDWYVWDTVRGIVSGNDPYVLLNEDTAQVTSTDFIDPLSSGFQITSSAPAAINALNGEYIFLAIA